MSQSDLAEGIDCRVCGQLSRQAFSREILRKYKISYFYCDACGFMQTEQPYWLDEAYQSAISTTDTGLVFRNLRSASMVATLLFYTSDRQARYLDAAGGYGLMTRLLRDIGFDFYWDDPYCANLMARGFEVAPDDRNFAAITAFEVLEHVISPVSFVEELLNRTTSRVLIFSTELFEGPAPDPDTWWYYAFKTGQHIAFYQPRTFEYVAKQLGLHFYSNRGLHMLTAKKMSPFVYRILTGQRTGKILSMLMKRRMKSRRLSDNTVMIQTGQA